MTTPSEALANVIEVLEQCLSELYSVHLKYGDKENARQHSKAIRLAESAIEKAKQ